jgi:hypothetical protein
MGKPLPLRHWLPPFLEVLHAILVMLQTLAIATVPQPGDSLTIWKASAPH